MNGARTTRADTAAIFGTAESQRIAEHPQHRRIRCNVHGTRLAVHAQCVFHGCRKRLSWRSATKPPQADTCLHSTRNSSAPPSRRDEANGVLWMACSERRALKGAFG